MPPDLPDCLSCGACCHSINPRLIALLGADSAHIPERLIAQESGESFMRMNEDAAPGCYVCAALGPGNVCAIYDRRPFLCREFERGSPECLQAIADLKRPPNERRH